MAAAPLLPPLVLDQVSGLAGGDGDQHPPKVAAVVEPGKSAELGTTAQAVEGAQCRVLLVGGPARRVSKPRRASRTRSAKYRSQSRREASGSPALRPPTQRVTEPEPSLSVVIAACPSSGLWSLASTIDANYIAPTGK